MTIKKWSEIIHTKRKKNAKKGKKNEKRREKRREKDDEEKKVNV